MCGSCTQGYYRSVKRCEVCPTANGATIFLYTSMCLLVVFVLWLYLSPEDASLSVMKRTWRRVPILRYLFEDVLQGRQAQTTVKILLGYAQCMGIFRRFHQVEWPESFLIIVDFMESAVEFLTLGLEFVPMDCVVPLQWSKYYSSFIFYLLLPIIGPMLLITIGFARAALTPARAGIRRVSWHRINTPELWNTIIWYFLFIYPGTARQILSVFDFTSEIHGVRYLYQDTQEKFADGPWTLFALLGSTGVIIWVLGIPLLFYFVARRSRKFKSHLTRSRAEVLTFSYEPHAWWVETVDMIRKLLLTGVIVIFENNPFQIWFGSLVSSVSLIGYLQTRAYADQVCEYLQITLQVALTMTYLTASVLIPRQYVPPTAEEDLRILLVGINIAVGSLVVLSSVIGFVLLRRNLQNRRLTYVMGGNVVNLHPPKSIDGFHLFLSHVWAHGQDQMATIKGMLHTMLPSCETFLDVDNLTDISNLEKHILETDLILIFCTRDYITSANCRREILEASRLTKPMLLITETDPNKGAPTVDSLRQELSVLEKRGRVTEAEVECITTNLIERVEAGDCLQWHREKQFKYAVLKAIAQVMLMTTGASGAPTLRLEKKHTSGELEKKMHMFGDKVKQLAKGVVHAPERAGGVFGLTGAVQSGHTRRRPSVAFVAASPLASPRTAPGNDLDEASTESSRCSKSEVGMIAMPDSTQRQRRHALKLADEVTLPSDAGKGLHIYMSAQYLKFPEGAERHESLFHQLQKHLSKLGAELYFDPQRLAMLPPEDALSVLMLCPGVFDNHVLLEELEATLTHGRPHIPQSTPRSRARRSTIGSNAIDLPIDEETRKGIIPLFSTVQPFGDYINSAPQDLKDLGIFTIMYEKWPDSSMLQEVAAKLIVKAREIKPSDAARKEKKRRRLALAMETAASIEGQISNTISSRIRFKLPCGPRVKLPLASSHMRKRFTKRERSYVVGSAVAQAPAAGAASGDGSICVPPLRVTPEHEPDSSLQVTTSLRGFVKDDEVPGRHTVDAVIAGAPATSVGGCSGDIREPPSQSVPTSLGVRQGSGRPALAQLVRKHSAEFCVCARFKEQRDQLTKQKDAVQQARQAVTAALHAESNRTPQGESKCSKSAGSKQGRASLLKAQRDELSRHREAVKRAREAMADLQAEASTCMAPSCSGSLVLPSVGSNIEERIQRAREYPRD